MKWKKIILATLALAVLTGSLYWGLHHSHEWKGVDENVVEKFAEQAGHPARKPYIDTDRGDLLLLVFLLAGTAGGFLLGYNFRTLFGDAPKKHEPDA